MSAAGLVMLVLSQLGVIAIVSLGIYLGLKHGDFAEELILKIIEVVVLFLVTVDVLVLVGVIGPGLPLSAKTGTELLIADFIDFGLVWAILAFDAEDHAWVIRSSAALMVAGLVEGLLVSGMIWTQHFVSANFPAPTVTVTRTVTATPGPAPTPTVTATTATATNSATTSGQSLSGEVTVAIAAAGAGGALLGGVGGLLAGLGAFSKHRDRSKRNQESSSMSAS